MQARNEHECMKTSAENRRVRALLNGLRTGELRPKPDFQRKLVWSNKDKVAFIDTVLSDLPFPEIYVAAGEVDLVTAAGTEMLVDGQQRVTTLQQYFSASPALKLPENIKAYGDLSVDEQTAFLNYEVAVRNLGIIDAEGIKEVFRRINSTSYSLNAMEIHNARYNGPLKQCADELAQDDFFSKHNVFSAAEIRRMRDVVFTLTVIVSMLSTYFNRDDEIELYLERYNDEFERHQEIVDRLNVCKKIVDACALPAKSRAWKKADLLALFVEIDRVVNKEGQALDEARLGVSTPKCHNLLAMMHFNRILKLHYKQRTIGLPGLLVGECFVRSYLRAL
jgi:hypothetical protein